MTVLTFRAEWHGERAAGINSGSEEVTISFKSDNIIEPETINYWREAIVDFYDGAKVSLIKTHARRS